MRFPLTGPRRKITLATAVAAPVTVTALALFGVAPIEALADSNACVAGGYLDVATTSRIAGWARDCDRPGTAIDVHIYVNGTFWRAVHAGDFRPDPALNGTYGFHIDNPGIAAGSRIETYAIGVTADGHSDNNNPQLTNSPTDLKLFIDHGAEGTGAEGYVVLDADRSDESTSNEDETTERVPVGSRAGDLVRVRQPDGNIQVYTVFRAPNPREVFNSTVLGAVGGAVGNLGKGELESYYEKSPGQIFLDGGAKVTKFVIGGVAGGLTGFTVGLFRDPNLFLVPGNFTNQFSNFVFGGGNIHTVDSTGGIWRK